MTWAHIRCQKGVSAIWADRKKAAPSAGENVLVIGAGPVGMGVCQFALAEDANVTVMDISDNRLAFVMEQVGVPQKVNVLSDGDKADGEVIVNAVRERFGGELPTCVIDATGAPPSMEKAFEFVAHGGRLVFVGHTKKVDSGRPREGRRGTWA